MTLCVAVQLAVKHPPTIVAMELAVTPSVAVAFFVAVTKPKFVNSHILVNCFIVVCACNNILVYLE